jgi:hypothetical protein
MLSIAVPAMTPAIDLAASGGPFVLAASLVASAFGGLRDGTLAVRFGRVRVRMSVVLRYALSVSRCRSPGGREPVRTPRPPGSWLSQGAGRHFDAISPSGLRLPSPHPL